METHMSPSESRNEQDPIRCEGEMTKLSEEDLCYFRKSLNSEVEQSKLILYLRSFNTATVGWMPRATASLVAL
jgi:hypothetical protein